MEVTAKIMPRTIYPSERTPLPIEQEAARSPEPLWTFVLQLVKSRPNKYRNARFGVHTPVLIKITVL